MGFVGGISSHMLERQNIRVLLRRELVSMGVLVCLQCGYDLRGQEVARCSECGAAFDPVLLGAKAEDADAPLQDRE